MEMFLGFELARNYRVKQLNVVTDLDTLKDELSKCNLKGTTTFAISVWSDIAAAIAQLNAASFEPSHSYIDSVEDDGPNVMIAFRDVVATDREEDESTQRLMDASLSYSTASSSLEDIQLALAPADDPPTPDTPAPAESTSGPTEGDQHGETSSDMLTAAPSESTFSVPGSEESSEAPTNAPSEGTASEAPSTGPEEVPVESTYESTAAPTEQEEPVIPSEAPTVGPTEGTSSGPTSGDDEEVIPGDDEYISDEPQITSSPTESHHHHHTNTPTSSRYTHPTHAPTKKECKCKNQTGCLSKHSAPCCDGLVCKDFRWFSQCVEDEAHHRHQVIFDNLVEVMMTIDYSSIVHPDG